MAANRFTVSHNALMPLQERLHPPRFAASGTFGRSQATYNKDRGPVDRSTTLKKLEALRAVAAHAQEAELSHALCRWLVFADAADVQKQQKQQPKQQQQQQQQLLLLLRLLLLLLLNVRCVGKLEPPA